GSQGPPARCARRVRPAAREPGGRARGGRRRGGARRGRTARAARSRELRVRRPPRQGRPQRRRPSGPERARAERVSRGAGHRRRRRHRAAPQLVLVPGIRPRLRGLLPRGRRDGGATYLRLSGAGHVLFPVGATRMLVRAQGGVASADLPAHRAFVLGGRGTLLGDEFRRWGGRRMALLHLEWRVPVPFLSLGVGPYARTPRTITVPPYVALGRAAGPVAGTPWTGSPDTRVTLGLGCEWLGG